MEPLVSIIIPTFNRAKSLINAIDSIIAQTYTNIEIIVIDDGSTDATESLVNSYCQKRDQFGKIKYYKQINAGAPTARNYGLLKSSGSFVVFFDSDDIMLPDRIRTQLTAIQNESADCCVCGFYVNSKNGSQYLPVKNNTSNLKSFLDRSIRGSTQSWMYKTSVVRHVNGYDTSLTCRQDLDLNFRILITNPVLSIVPIPLSIFISHNGEERIMNNWRSQSCIDSTLRYHLKVLKYLIINRNFIDLYLEFHVLFHDLEHIMLTDKYFIKKLRKKIIGITHNRSLIDRTKISLIFNYYRFYYQIKNIKSKLSR
jgi:glycosyltransferase involved in cell wall biosynthesis